MSDDRNDGSMPPPSGPAAVPPPLAPTPLPAAPQYPPQPYYPPAPGNKTALWVILAFAAGVGLTLLTLWLTGHLWNTRTSSYASPYASSSPATTGATGMRPSGGGFTAPPPVSSAAGYAPTEDALVGSWGPRCPGSRDSDSVTFTADHSAIGSGESGTWSLSGSYVTVTTSRQTLNLNWEMLDANSARVTRSGDSRARMIYRCP